MIMFGMTAASNFEWLTNKTKIRKSRVNNCHWAMCSNK